MSTAIMNRPPAVDPPTPFTKRLLTAREYLAIEREALTKSEFLRGEMIPMPGASLEHCQINSKLNFYLQFALMGTDCIVLSGDMRVRVAATGLYTYPDALVVRGEPVVEEEELDVLLNPCLIAEILSKSTEKYDRGAKFDHYRTVDSLREYVLVSQDRYAVELFVRQDDGTWAKSGYTGREGTVTFPSLGVEIPMAKIYEGVKIENPTVS